jgi:precorrin-6A/cobalt-precorrin-6A reductase
MATRVLILGGTAEALRSAEACAARSDLATITSLAGTTRSPRPPAGEVRVGGFGGRDGLERYLREHRIDRVVDATHPFASRIGRNALKACRAAAVPRIRLLRPPWRRVAGDHWIEVDSLTEAARHLPPGARVFLSVGSRDLDAFAGLEHGFVVRSIEPPAVDLPGSRWLGARGPFRVADELELLRAHAIDVVVTKASGGEATYAKLAAARQLCLQVFMVRRPPPPPGPVVDSVEAVLAWLGHPVPPEALAGRST